MAAMRYGLIGEKLSHSLSVPIHLAFFREMGLDAAYDLIEIPKTDFARRLPQVLDTYDGLNVTIPYKRDVMPFLRKMDPLAAEAGAVNTILCGARAGYNTDVAGFSDMLQRHGIAVGNQACYILGTGGASLAVHVALRQLGAASITFVSRHPTGEQIGYRDLRDRFAGVIINCTPVGMYPHTDGCPLDLETLEHILPRCTGVADLIYNPPETNLTRAAADRGIPWCTGLSMLVAQAMEAESIWQGKPIEKQLTDQILRELREKEQ